MQRFYPELTDATQSFFVNASDISPCEVDDVLTAPLLFDQLIPLKGSNPKTYALDHDVKLKNIYLRLSEYDVVAIDVSESVSALARTRGDVPHLVILSGKGKFSLPTVEGASVSLEFQGVVALLRSLVDFEASIVEYEGLQQEPTLLGYDLELYDAFEVRST